MAPLAEAGFHVIAPDQRGYGHSSAPTEITDYGIGNLTDDLLSLLDHFGKDDAVFVGHDWGALIVWDLARLHPERVRAVVGVSVPFTMWPAPPTELMKMLYGDRFFYILYFQQPGAAENELGADPYDSLAKVMWSASGVRFAQRDTSAELPPMVGTGFLTMMSAAPPRPFTGPEGPWLTEDDLQTYADEFAHSGFFGPISYYRNLDANFDIIKDLGPERVAMPVYFIGGTQDVVNVMDPTGVERMRTRYPTSAARRSSKTWVTGPSKKPQQPSTKLCWGSCKLSSFLAAFAALPTLQFAQEAEQFEVQPHQGDDEGEGGEPLHALRQALLAALLDEVEVDRQVHRSQAGREDAEADAEQAGGVQERDATTEQVDDEREEVEHHQTHRCGDDDPAESVGDLDDLGAIQKQHHCEHAEGGTDGLKHDAVLIRLVGLGDDAEEEPFADGVHGTEELGPHRPEVDGDRAGEPDEDADQCKCREATDFAPLIFRTRLPADDGGCEQHDQQHTGSADGATDSHHLRVPRADRAIGDGSPARLGVGAAQPGSRAALFQVLSLSMGFAMDASLGERVTDRTLQPPMVFLSVILVRSESWALAPSHRSMSGGAVSNPLHDVAISTMTSLSKWARWASAVVPLLDDQVAARLRDGGAQIDVAAAGLHPRQHDVLRQHRHQRLRIGGVEPHRHDRQLDRVIRWVADRLPVWPGCHARERYPVRLYRISSMIHDLTTGGVRCLTCWVS